MIYRAAWSLAFALVGILSLLTWASIDVYLCDTFPALCMPPAGECGGGLDTCPLTTHTIVGLIGVLFLPIVLFAALGYVLAARKKSVVKLMACLFVLVALHWVVTFLLTRVFHA